MLTIQQKRLSLAIPDQSMEPVLTRKVIHHFFEQGLDGPSIDRSKDIKLALRLRRDVAAELNLPYPGGGLWDFWVLDCFR